MTRWEKPRAPWHPQFREAYRRMYNQVKSSAKPLMRNGQGVYHLEASLQIQGFDTKGFDIASFEAGRIQALDQMAKHLFRAIRMDDEAVEYHSSPPS